MWLILDGDHVLFDSLGASAPTVSLAGSINPSSITVDADFDYVLRSDVGGKIVGASGLTKRGAGTLTLDTDNSYTGPTVIQAGVVQLGAADAHGSTGTGPITNNSALVFNRTDTVIVTNTITGSGSLTNLGKALSPCRAQTFTTARLPQKQAASYWRGTKRSIRRTSLSPPPRRPAQPGQPNSGFRAGWSLAPAPRFTSPAPPPRLIAVALCLAPSEPTVLMVPSCWTEAETMASRRKEWALNSM